MIIIDNLLKKRQEEKKPIRVGLVGAGYMGRGIALQIVTAVPGMTLAAIANRTLLEADRAYKNAGIHSVVTATNSSQIQDALQKEKPVITEDAELVCKADAIDVIIEATGAANTWLRPATSMPSRALSFLICLISFFSPDVPT